jgi:hypothetical protein
MSQTRDADGVAGNYLWGSGTVGLDHSVDHLAQTCSGRRGGGKYQVRFLHR